MSFFTVNWFTIRINFQVQLSFVIDKIIWFNLILSNHKIRSQNCHSVNRVQSKRMLAFVIFIIFVNCRVGKFNTQFYFVRIRFKLENIFWDWHTRNIQKFIRISLNVFRTFSQLKAQRIIRRALLVVKRLELRISNGKWLYWVIRYSSVVDA